MLDNRKWEHVAPEIPEEFHAKFEDTLSVLERRPSGKKGKFRIFMTAAVICALCTATVAANEIMKWSDTLKEIFQPSEKQQEELVNEGFVQSVKQTKEQNGVKITLTEALQDSRSIYMLFEVEAPEDMVLDDNVAFEDGLNVTIDGKDISEVVNTNMAGGGGFVSDWKLKQESPNIKYYEIRYHWDKNCDLSGKTVKTYLRNLTVDADKAMPGEVAVEGTWEFEWQIGNVGSEKRIEINKTYDFGGYDICVKYMDISPLGYIIYADYDDAMKVEEDERNTFTYEGDDPGMEIGDRLSIQSVEYKDGTREELLCGGGSYTGDKENGVYKVSQSFDKIVDVENLKSVSLMGGAVEMELP